MKRNEIALLILIIGLSIGIAYAAGQALLGNATSKPVSVETAEAISATVAAPDEKVFNERAINPTVPVKISDTNNQQPFGNN